MRLGGPRSRPYNSRKISRVQLGIEPGTSWMAVRHANHYTKQEVIYIFFFRGYVGVCIPLKHSENFIGEKNTFHNFEINSIQIPEDGKLCKHSNFSAVCWLNCTVMCSVTVILNAAPSLLAAF